MSEERTGEAPGYGATAARFDAMAAQEDLWLRRTGAYHRLVGNICRSLIPPGQRVLEVGCGRGDLLASLEPESGVGVDVSPEMVRLARERHPELDVRLKAGESLSLGQTFDFILMTDLVPYVEDLQALFESVARHSDSHTRVIVSTYSNLWRPLLAVLVGLRLRPRTRWAWVRSFGEVSPHAPCCSRASRGGGSTRASRRASRTCPGG